MMALKSEFLSERDLLIHFGFKESHFTYLSDGNVVLDLDKLTTDWCFSSSRRLFVENVQAYLRLL